MSGNLSKLPLHDLKELNKISDFVAKNITDVQKMLNAFTDPSDVKLFWDSKVPENDETWNNFISLTPSDHKYVMREIQNYQNFYEDLSETVRSMREKDTDTDCEDYYKMILDLNEKLSKMVDEAKFGENTTPSSIVCKLHKSFIQEHEKLESMVQRVELVVVRNGWKKSMQSIKKLRDDQKNYERKIDEISEGFRSLSQQKEMIEKERGEMLNNQNMLLQLIADLKQQQGTLLQENREMKQKQDILLEENAAIKVKLETILSNTGANGRKSYFIH